MYFMRPNTTTVPFELGSRVVHYYDVENVGVIVAPAEEDAIGGRYWVIRDGGFDTENPCREDYLLHADEHRIKCGGCEGYHPSVQGVRDCHTDNDLQETEAASERAAWPYI